MLWSAEAAKSQWVRAEADTARAAPTLVQATLDGTMPPMPFNQIQCADLKGWDGQRIAPGWRKLVASVGELAGPRRTTAGEARTASRDVSVCVLPFQNMSGDAEQEYFSDGISEDITTDLSKVSALEVIARNTAFTFKGQSVNVCDVAQEARRHARARRQRPQGRQPGADHRAADRRHAPAGTSGPTATTATSPTSSRSRTRFRRRSSAALKLKLLPEEKKAIEKRGTTNAEAYNLYLLARQYWVTGNHGDTRREERVMRICSRAVEIDPYYAARLGTARHRPIEPALSASASEVDDGFAAAHAALAIDPTIAEAHLPMFKRLQERGQFDAAAAEMEAAIRLGAELLGGEQGGRPLLSDHAATSRPRRAITKKPSS